MKALDLKLMRDFQRLWVQGVAIDVVLACGVAILLTAFGMHRALVDTRDAYYERNRFADIFAEARRAPLSLLEEIRAIPGLRMLEARVQGMAVLDLPDRDAVAMGRLLAWPEDGAPLLNLPILRSGTPPERPGEVMISDAFAKANGFVPGDVFSANINGKARDLTITGTAVSPEFIYTIGPGALMPDNAGFGILWLTQADIASAFDMVGAFNHLALRLGIDAVPADVIEALDQLLDPYGGRGAYGRDSQISDAFVAAEIDQLRAMAMVVPPVFFAIAAFLVGMVMSRIVTLERAEIGLLKALGYGDGQIALHYLLLAGMIAGLGVALGWVAGSILARAMAGQYAQFFDFPYLIFHVPGWVYAMSALAGLASTLVGALRAALIAARLPPAIAMQPPAPPVFRKTGIDRAMAALRLRQTTTMVLRSLIRWPLRSALTAVGLGAATASVIAAGFMFGALDRIIDLAFNQTYRQDAAILLSAELPISALVDIRRLPGVMQAEAQQFHPATLRRGPREKRVSIEARPYGAELSRVIGADGTAIEPPPGGILLSDRLAAQLEAGVGDRLWVSFHTGQRETHEMVVAGLIEQYFGLGAYVEMGHLDQLFRRSPQMSVANILYDPAMLPDLQRALHATPLLGGVIEMTENRQSFQETISENVVVVNGVYAVIAVLITIGVAYNAARIQLSERARELASLRIIGFSRAEVSLVLIGETMLIALVAQPLGWLMGALIAAALARGFSSDIYAIPLVLAPADFARASLVVLGASLASVLIVRRRIDRMDLVAVMKTRE
ncbi:FtsX-like permease family protein [Roseicyclus sp.]|uniref:ABC transporter permease n=1 Tax=Roseicyclus sp. TaxID=1914329 RepID=UPI001BCC42D2|nr:FtsX-like permease family protein [Roseicyclus sp.]